MVAEKLVRIYVDTNNIILGGLTKASLRRITEDLRVGDNVIARDIAEMADFSAVVVEIVGNKANLRLDWDTAQPWDTTKDEK
jgi:hypothetical protein